MILIFLFIYVACEKGAHDGLYKHDSYLFKKNKLYVLKISICELLVREAHGGG